MSETGSDGYALELDPAEIERYRMMAQLARESEADLWQAAGLAPGATVADVGCGPGALLPALVDSVGEQGRVHAVDGNAAAVGQAQALVAANGWDNVTVGVATADATGLEPGAYDVVMMRHVLAHNGPREQAIVDHLATLAKPGACVYLVDVYESGFGLRPDDPEVRELNDAYLRFHLARGNDIRTGLRLDVLLEAAGLEVVTYRGWYNIAKPQGAVRPPSWAARDSMVEAGVASREDIQRWGAALDRLATQSPTIFAPLFGAVGRRRAV
jgi:SAM-dependent methyltransferase